MRCLLYMALNMVRSGGSEFRKLHSGYADLLGRRDTDMPVCIDGFRYVLSILPR